MKKIIILAFFALVSQSIYAQQKIQFAVKYLPMHNYATSFKMDMDMNMNIGDSTVAKALKDAGQPASMLMKINMVTDLNLSTQAQDAKKNVPLTMSASMNGQAIPIPQTNLKGLAYLGHYSNETKKLAIDGVQGGALDADKKATAEAQLAQIFNQYSFPDTTLKIGDTFEQTMPMTVPTAAGNTDILTKIKYTLKEIKANEAIFDMTQTADATVNIPQAGGDMVMKGTGIGSMVYDIAGKFPVRSTINMDFAFKMSVQGAPISGTMKGISVTDVKVTKK
jgi:hypothetical protein